MTKKHFDFAARLVASAPSRRMRTVLTRFCIDLFTPFNPRFDAQRFTARVQDLSKGGDAR